MDTSARGIDFLIRHEGVRLRAYQDTAGVWTIGVGHTAASGPPKPVRGMAITADQAKSILAHDLAKFEDRVERALPGVPQTVFDGAVSFDFNTGAIHRASWVTKFKAGKFRESEVALKLWCKSSGRVVKGLVNRRADEADLIFRGKYGADNP